MTTAPLLSVVLPVYNVAPYLPACLDSLAAQTRPIDELIAVDDGSTDACPEILHAYRDKLPTMRIIRQENGGLSAARNTGLRAASGVWLAFVDSDDFVAPQMYSRMLTAAQDNDLDLLLCNAMYHFEGRESDRPIYPPLPASGVVSGKAWLQNRLTNDRILHMVWMHLYRRDFLEKNGFTFVPRLIHEDVIWTTRVLLAATRLAYLDDPLYFYRIPIRRFTEEQARLRLEAIIRSSIINAETLLDLSTTLTDTPTLRSLLQHQAVDGAFSIFHKIEKISSPSWRQARYQEVSQSHLLPLLWRNAQSWPQRRRIVRHALKTLFKK
ncbi:MAG TPA: glycosyltransferase [Accumulibacter sp.]|nr:glycosyltransferase [Accumulibacter sp.]HMW17545.1 glycosyltransferase [Accumulibacter sp.]HMX22410.1 glycosyltransferase [Accumulibacter sp.]HMY05999.1 glycosyltransferase [Accumulibacter sp.]HNC17623.1 glycosyltransferase [Accumulibacter sp.]